MFQDSETGKARTTVGLLERAIVTSMIVPWGTGLIVADRGQMTPDYLCLSRNGLQSRSNRSSLQDNWFGQLLHPIIDFLKRSVKLPSHSTNHHFTNLVDQRKMDRLNLGFGLTSRIELSANG